MRILLPLCAGVMLGRYFRPDIIFLLLSATLAAGSFIASLFRNNRETNYFFIIPAAITLFLAGLILYTLEKSGISQLDTEESVFACSLSDYPVRKAKSIMLKVNLYGRVNEYGQERLHGSLLLYHRNDSSVLKMLPGDILVIRCTPEGITVRGNPDEFDYRFYLENQGIRYFSFTDRNSILKHLQPRNRKAVHRSLIIRERIIDMYRQRGITGEKLALVSAITLGQKNMLDPEQKSFFMKAGVMHIMAVSGLHTVILSLFVFKILFFLKGRLNIIRIVITLTVLWAFAFITGLTPSVLRATLMFSFLQAGNLLKRPANGINSVLASAFILILIRPSVIYDAGFQLSYSAVIFIIAFYRDLYQMLIFRNYLSDKIWQSAAVTLTAQAGTFALTITLFNRFPTWFILTNIIIVPLSSLVVITGCIIPLLYPLEMISRGVAVILSHLTGLTELLTQHAANLPFATVENLGMSPVQCFLLSVTVFLFTGYFLKRSFSVLIPLTALLFYFIAGTVNDIKVRSTSELIVYNTPGHSDIGIRTGKTLALYSDTSVISAEVRRHSSVRGLRTRLNYTGNCNQSIKAGNTRIIIAGSQTLSADDISGAGIIILTGKSCETLLQSLKMNRHIHIIVSDGTTGYSRQSSGETGYGVYYVRKSGAFRISI